ncbi:Atu4866 domain-containing protein [Actinoplanes sp. NPDC020271]|uniref:Atu4866 domain-containing protein n=1 Tax=Actinoplanes sp. NPDC020271 TaxID=3363896 RepID=UPI0037A7A747
MHSNSPHVDTPILDAAAMLAIAMGRTTEDGLGVVPERPRVITGAAVVGAWRSFDGTVKLQIKTDGTYAGEVAGRRSRPHGTYRIDGDAVVLQDDTSGLNTPVTLIHDGELEMAGHRLLPE